MLLDIAKGWLPVFVAKMLLNGSNIPEMTTILLSLAIAMAAILGHVFTPYLKFKGGKGVATSCGVFLGLIPVALGIALIVFILTIWVSKYVSLGSILAALTLFAAELVIQLRTNWDDWPLLVFAGVVAGLIIFMHRSNIKRLIAGNENKLNFQKQK